MLNIPGGGMFRYFLAEGPGLQQNEGFQEVFFFRDPENSGAASGGRIRFRLVE